MAVIFSLIALLLALVFLVFPYGIAYTNTTRVDLPNGEFYDIGERKFVLYGDTMAIFFAVLALIEAISQHFS